MLEESNKSWSGGYREREMAFWNEEPPTESKMIN